MLCRSLLLSTVVLALAGCESQPERKPTAEKVAPGTRNTLDARTASTFNAGRPSADVDSLRRAREQDYQTQINDLISAPRLAHRSPQYPHHLTADTWDPSVREKIRLVYLLKEDLEAAFPEYRKELEAAEDEFERRKMEVDVTQKYKERLDSERAKAVNTVLTEVASVSCSEYDFERGGYCLFNSDGGGQPDRKRLMHYHGCDCTTMRNWITGFVFENERTIYDGGRVDLLLPLELNCMPRSVGTGNLGVFLTVAEGDARKLDLHGLDEEGWVGIQFFYVPRQFTSAGGLKRTSTFQAVEADLIALRVLAHKEVYHPDARAITPLIYCGPYQHLSADTTWGSF